MTRQWNCSKRHEFICRETSNKASIAVNMENQARYYWALGQTTKALKRIQEAEPRLFLNWGNRVALQKEFR